ncbi:mechanosensitive ion channel family protein [Fodinibius halophilus]|uniref:Mechanosensitive ion channel n=1 Tax=Fodinibius halophilus TaxID=1736908 RepID=A0A6M1T7S0_9BACT|nr:mechanosensitive ion channel domain-containing protein [Fodinibius halophilus]NGP88673.1 mechanosensitive ion channel [Fodinibius halophilus]
MEEFRSILEKMMPQLVEYGLKVAGAILILVVGWTVAGWFSKKVRRHCESSQTIDDTLTPLLAKLTKILGLTVVVIFVLNMVGIQTASLVAVLGAAGLAAGLAWQGTLSDVAAGVMLLVMRPFNVGDSVDIAGTSGTVEEIGLVITKINTFDNVAVVLPNSNVWGNNIKNMSVNEKRRLDLVIGFGYDDDIDHAMETINEILEKEDRVLADPEPQVAVSELGGSSVNLIVRPWAKKEDFWSLKYDLTKRIKEQFDEEGINFPYPSKDVYLHKDVG